MIDQKIQYHIKYITILYNTYNNDGCINQIDSIIIQNSINASDNNSNNGKNIDIADDNDSIGINIAFIYLINNML